MSKIDIYIEGSRLGANQQVWISLSSNIFGIGESRAYEVCENTKINPQTKVRDLTSEEIEMIRAAIKAKAWVLTTNLRQQVRQSIDEKKRMRSYQGRRHAVGLPVRGQNTQKNAKTARRRGGKGKNS